MKVFISHGSHDSWIARQMARCIAECGVETFLDVYDIQTGDDWQDRLFAEIDATDELVVLVTPFSRDRVWLWVEIGAAMKVNKPVRPILYGLSMRDLVKSGNAGPLPGLHARSLNEFDSYLVELRARMPHDQ
jgi:hypothetical protein